MKKDRIITWSLLAIATLFVILYIVNKNKELSYIYLIIGCVFCFAYAFFYDHMNRKSKKERREESTKEDKVFKNKIAENRDLSIVTKVIYDIYNSNIAELNDIIKKTSCDISYDYDNEENTFYLQIDSILGAKRKEAFFLDLMGNGKEGILISNGQEEDISKLTYDELVSKIISLVKANVKTSDKIDFVIKGSKFELYAYIFFAVAIIAGIVAIIVTKVINGFETGAFIGMLCSLSAFLLLVFFGIYVYFKEELRLENGIYIYKGIFKTRSCNAKDVKEVMVDTSGRAIKVIFIGKNNQILLQYRDLGTTFKSGELKRSLNYYKVPLRIDYSL